MEVVDLLRVQLGLVQHTRSLDRSSWQKISSSRVGWHPSRFVASKHRNCRHVRNEHCAPTRDTKPTQISSKAIYQYQEFSTNKLVLILVSV